MCLKLLDFRLHLHLHRLPLSLEVHLVGVKLISLSTAQKILHISLLLVDHQHQNQHHTFQNFIKEVLIGTP